MKTMPKNLKNHVTRSLPRGSVLAFDAGKNTIRMMCLKGCVWLTQEKDPLDHILEPGMEFAAGNKGRTVIQAMAGRSRANGESLIRFSAADSAILV